MHKISESLGPAGNVQMMVFGNLGERSATGVGFTRNPSTGAKEFDGEFLQTAQGEDGVAGIRTPVPVAELEKFLPEAYRQLRRIAQRLERHYRDMQDFEYTVEEGTLYMLQTRTGKRTGRAALKIAYDMVKEKLITPREAVMRVEPAQLEQLLHPIIDDSQPLKVIAKGLPASPGAAVGRGGFTGGGGAAPGRAHGAAPAAGGGGGGGLGSRPRRAGRPGRLRAGHPGAGRDGPRRHPRHGRGRRHPDCARGNDKPRGGGRPRGGEGR